MGIKRDKIQIRLILIMILGLCIWNFTIMDVCAASKPSKENILDIQGFVVGDMWNEGICNISWYYEYRTDCYGKPMNIEKTVKKFNKTMKTAKKWNTVIMSLKEKKYKNLKKHWKVLYKEAKKLQKKINEQDFSEMKKSEKSYKLKKEKFRKYTYIITDDVIALW